MLSADKNVTLTEFQIQTLQIREKELNYFVSLYNSISGMTRSAIQEAYRHRCNVGWIWVLISEDAVSREHLHYSRDHLPSDHRISCRT